MDDVKALQIVRKEIQQRIDDYSASLVRGDAKDHAEYRYQCGVIYGLNLADRELVDLMSAMEHNEDD